MQPSAQLLSQALCLPIDGADAGDVVLRADALGEEPVADLPGEHGRVVLLVPRDGVHDARRRHLRLRAADHARLEVARLVEPATGIGW